MRAELGEQVSRSPLPMPTDQRDEDEKQQGWGLEEGETSPWPIISMSEGGGLALFPFYDHSLGGTEAWMWSRATQQWWQWAFKCSLHTRGEGGL